MAILKTRWNKPVLKETEDNTIIPEKKVIIPVVEEQPETITPVAVVDDPTAEEFIATLPKKQPSRKKVTKIIEE
jgi:hypothetical protein